MNNIEKPQPRTIKETISEAKTVHEVIETCLKTSKESPKSKLELYSFAAEKLLELGDTEKAFDMLKMAQEIAILDRKEEQMDFMDRIAQKMLAVGEENDRAAQKMENAGEENNQAAQKMSQASMINLEASEGMMRARHST